MPFVEVTKATQGGHNAEVSDRPCMSCTSPQAKPDDIHIYVRLPVELVVSTFGAHLFNEGRSVRLGFMEGVDSDAGFIMLTHNPRGYTFTRPATGSAGYTSKMGYGVFKYYSPASAPQDITAMEYSVDGPALLLQVPQWFNYSKRVVARPTMIATPTRPKGRPRHDIQGAHK